MASFTADDVYERVPFSKIEELAIVEEYAKRQTVLEGKFTPSHTKADRRRAWADLPAAVNSISNNGLRTVAQLKKKRQNITSAAKKKLTQMKRPGTGGGKRDQPPTAAEEAVLVSLQGRPSLEGLDVSVDTAEPTVQNDLPQVIDESGNIIHVTYMNMDVSGEECEEVKQPHVEESSLSSTNLSKKKMYNSKDVTHNYCLYLKAATACCQVKERVLKLQEMKLRRELDLDEPNTEE